jgi:hypothetical protein
MEGGVMDDPAEKYANDLDPKHVAAMSIVVNAYHMLKLAEPHLAALSKAEMSSHSVLHITNLTFYRDLIGSKRFAAQMKFVRAALAFIKTSDELASDLKLDRP